MGNIFTWGSFWSKTRHIILLEILAHIYSILECVGANSSLYIVAHIHIQHTPTKQPTPQLKTYQTTKPPIFFFQLYRSCTSTFQRQKQ